MKSLWYAALEIPALRNTARAQTTFVETFENGNQTRSCKT
ncbi:MAG: hypothetical protein ACI8QZ_000131 [Chlamydiales bacterium]|jgi:hypothetical protein